MRADDVKARPTAVLARWIIFGVLLGLLPIFAGLLRFLSRGDAPSVVDLISHGELLLPCAGISAASIGELLGFRVRRPLLAIISGGSATLVLMASCVYYAIVTSASPGVQLDPEVISGVSLGLFLAAVLSGAASRLVGGSNHD